jgi:hypothetical protein
VAIRVSKEKHGSSAAGKSAAQRNPTREAASQFRSSVALGVIENFGKAFQLRRHFDPLLLTDLCDAHQARRLE